ncbi:E3 ubiquitin-protein ligase PUB23-like [Typha latifolia]|uniref:E3 ubiquitin-protein ligase PUB23-like n=1 Tax=Typha latifolia TaxID=4733 RepID=UPI003C2D683D
MEGVEVPAYFLCPISLQIMRDPVTLSTGITYDRDSIERWLFSGDHHTCPVTREPLLPDLELITPNHTLRRLIQSWCVANASSGVERFPTPRAPVDKSQIADLLRQAKSPESQVVPLRKLRAVVVKSDRSKRCVEALGGIDLLLSMVKKTISSLTLPQQEQEEICDEALAVLSSLQISEQQENIDDFIAILTAILARPNYYKSRVYAILLLKNLVSVMSPARLIATSAQLIAEVVNVLRGGVSWQATKAALHVLCQLCRHGRNRVKAVEAGAVPVVVELLLVLPERRVCEMVLVVLDHLCGCAEGRAELVGHAAGIAAVSKRILRVSHAASESAVRVLHSVATFSATPAVLHEMVQVGVVAKLCMVMQVDCGMKVKEKVLEILRLHSRVWRNSPCLAPQLKDIYPRS